MNGVLESEIRQDRSMALVLRDETKTDRLEKIVRDLITELGVDITDQHFEGTPARVARLYRELTRGSRVDPSKILKTFNSKRCERRNYKPTTRGLREVTEDNVRIARS